jgi:O-antigen/teichoic acid export membrane protein
MEAKEEKPSAAQTPEIGQRPSRIEAGRWMLSSTVLAGPIRLAMRVILARILQPVSFGLLCLANSTAISLCGITNIGLDTAVNRYTAENYRRDTPLGRYYAALIFILTLIVSSVFLVTAYCLLPYWSDRIFPHSTPGMTIGLCILLAWLNVLVTYGSNLLNGLQLFRDIALSAFAQTVVTMAGALLGGFLLGTNGAILGYLAGTVFCIAYYLRVLWKFDPQLFRQGGSFQRQDVGQILRFSIPIWLGTLAVAPIMTLAMSLLDRQPGGARELGIFSTANPIRMVLGVLPGIVGPVIGPAIMEEGGHLGNPAAYIKLLKDSLSATSFLTLPVLVVLLGWHHLIFMIYGAAYAGSADIFVPLVTSAAMSFIVSPAQYAMLAKNKIWPLQILACFNSIALLGLAYLWIPTSLGQGLGWAVLVAEVLTAIGMQEYCTWSGVIPGSLRRHFYGYTGILMSILAATCFLPNRILEVVAFPAAAILAVCIVRMNPNIMNWLDRSVPASLRPVLARVAALVVRKPC